MMDHTMTKNPDSIPYNIWPAEALRLAEREAADSLGLTLFELMQRAGEAAFQLASGAYPASAHWLILCGHGNNGGDGYVVAGGGVSRVRKQAQGRRDRLRFAAIACRQRLAADRRAQRLRKLHPRFALPCPRQADHHLPGADHLSRLGERFHHHAVGIRQQSGIVGGVLRHVCLRLGRAEVGSRRLCRRVDLVELRRRDGAAHADAPDPRPGRG